MKKALTCTRSAAIAAALATTCALLSTPHAALAQPFPPVIKEEPLPDLNLAEPKSNPGKYQAVPHGGAQYVAFGDSYAANPNTEEQYEARQDGDPCRWGDNSYPMHLSKNFSSFFNATCSGAVIEQDYFKAAPVTARLSQLVDRAENVHALGPQTQLVTITIGGNEAWYAIRDYGHLGSSKMITPAEYSRRIGPSIARIRAQAPNARILLVGYPEFVGADNRLCYIDTTRYGFPLKIVVHDPTQRTYIKALNDAMRMSAPDLGAEYVDVFTPSQGHGSCVPDDQRWVKNLLDAPERDPHLILHLNEVGTKEQARIVGEYLKLDNLPQL